MPQSQIEYINKNTFEDWKRLTNGKASCAAVMIGVGQNKNAGHLMFASAQGVQMTYAINILRSVADQLEAQLPKEEKIANEKVVERLAWHKRLWKKIWSHKPLKVTETKLQGTEPGDAKVVGIDKNQN